MKGAKMMKEFREVMLNENDKPVLHPWETAERLSKVETRTVGPGIVVQGWSYWKITANVAVVK